MPIIQRAAPKPLPPEGPAKLLITNVTYGQSKDKHTPFFGLTLRDLTTGLTLRDRVYLTEGSSWKFEALCRSMGHELPAGPYRMQIDDLTNRVVFGVIAYKPLPDGRMSAEMRTYWTKGWAIKQEGRLGSIPDPKGISGSVKLPAVEPEVEPPDPEPTPEQLAAMYANEEPAEPPVGPTPVSPAPVQPVPATVKPLSEGISDAEMAEALAYAKQARARREAEKGK